MWYIMIRFKWTWKLRRQTEFLMVWGYTGQYEAEKRGWMVYNAYAYSTHQQACDAIKDGA